MNIKKLRNRKIFILAFLIVCTGIIITFLPSLARFKNRNPLDISTVWDGTVAASYRSGSGTKSDPYIISSGKELSYFSNMLKNTSYEGKYFELSNDIILNNGLFSYEDTPTYTLNNSKFYIKNKTNDYYDNQEFSGIKIGTLNSFNSLDNFKGHFNGNFYTIYGLYITSSNSDSGLFTNLLGEVKNLYVTNSLIEGGSTTGGIASSATNATIKNVLFSGNVIGNKEIKKETEQLPLNDLNLIENQTENIVIPTRQKNGTITNATLTGTCTTNFNLNDKNIECQNSTFEVTLDNNYSNSIEIKASVALSLTNMTLNLSYNIGYTGGLIGVGENITIENAINKANVVASDTAGGLIALAKDKINITQSYNSGNINTVPTYSGLVGVIENLNTTSTIKNSYNNSGNNSGFVGNVFNSQNLLTIENSFEAGKNYAFIKKIENSKVTFNNVYSIGTNVFKEQDVEGTVNTINSDTLKNKDFMINTLKFNEFQSAENQESNQNFAWLYEPNELPTLFIDDLQNPIATLHVGTNSWNSLGFDDKKIYYQSNVAFRIEEISNVRPIKEAYYYIQRSDELLSTKDLENISWEPYEETISLTENGSYCVYAKVIDTNNHVYYINSDLIIIDSEKPEVKIMGLNKEWSTYTENLSNTFINSNTEFSITATDDISGLKSIQYLLSDTPLNISTLETSTWEDYQTPISIDSLGSKIIYVKVVDNSNNITYANSDYIVYEGYTLNKMIIGSSNETDRDITEHSKVTYNFTYKELKNIEDNISHYLCANVPFPKSTKITLKDNKNKKVYTHKVTEEKLKIAFTEFKELGKGNMDVYYKEEKIDSTDEDFTIIIDLKDTTLNNGIKGMEIYLELQDTNGSTKRSTIKSTLKAINIHTLSDSIPTISTSYSGNAIDLNSDSVETVDLTLNIEKSLKEEIPVYDSTFDDKLKGLQIKLIDESSNTVEKQYLKNIRFKVGDKYYSPNNDGITRINVGTEQNITLTIFTSSNSTNLKEGSYYFKISSVSAYDGLYSNLKSREEITIPAYIDKQKSDQTYNFNIEEQSDYRILNRSDQNVSLKFLMKYLSNCENPNIRISLYQKNKLTAYDQTYKLLDLQNYTEDPLEKVIDKVYYASKLLNSSTSEFNLNLDLTKFEPNGYKLTFELYDNNKKIGTIDKKFIIR